MANIYGVTVFGAVSAQSDGVSVSPSYTFESDRSTGFYKSSTGVGLTGTLTGAASGYTATPVYAESATSYLGAATVVQGSASSFTVFVWPAVRRGDFIEITPVGAGVSSLSSGLVLHSHCTQNGQCEVRHSNVSTLVQNQSAVSYFIRRVSMF